MDRLRSTESALIHDLLMVPTAWLLAYWLRFNLEMPPAEIFAGALKSLAVLIPVQLLAFHVFGLYRGIWRFASLPDLLRILKAVAVGTAISMSLIFLLTRGIGIPRSVPILYTVFLLMLLSGPRLLYRWMKDRHLYLRSGQRVLIVGSGAAGEMLARDLLRNHSHDSFLPIAFVDDNPKRHGRDIHGIPVSGKSADIPHLADDLEIDLIMLAIPSADSAHMRRVVEQCELSGVPFRTVPQLQDLVSGKVSINELREVSIDDLLGREQVSLDWQSIQQKLSGRDILVTGSGGSIGSELCRQIARLEPRKLILVEISEFNLYTIEMELKAQFPQLNIHCHLGDVTDSPFIDYVFKTHQPNVVYHAAAYKHVPMLEPQIRQAVRNNSLGTRCVAETASRYDCDEFVLVSTDKAVNPTNIMGASKRLAEIYCQNLNGRSNTHFITVRFGNVLGSAGSVIPLFREQIASGGPVTVTDPRMERYFMTIPEACQLIMQTTAMGKGGEIFVLDMGEPVKIKYLAEQMIMLSGKVPGEDIEIEYIGLRPGEKLFEELFHEQEQLTGTLHEKVLLASHRQVQWELLEETLQQMEESCRHMDHTQLETQLKSLVPEYDPQDNSPSDEKSADIIYLKQ
ncbi:MAG: nucleoside-diphosphate sugar epimerase/dehydratase [Sedimenticola sp.]